MQIRKTYKGILNGSYCISCGHIEEGMIVEEEITIYYPDNGKVFIKDNTEYDYVIEQEGVTISDYEERDKIENIGE